jgi:hypothetical protein
VSASLTARRSGDERDSTLEADASLDHLLPHKIAENSLARWCACHGIGDNDVFSNTNEAIPPVATGRSGPDTITRQELRGLGRSKRGTTTA